jgi:hypothetical protein
VLRYCPSESQRLNGGPRPQPLPPGSRGSAGYTVVAHREISMTWCCRLDLGLTVGTWRCGKLKPPHTRSLAWCVLIIASPAAQGSPHASGMHATTGSKKGLICIDYCMDSCRPCPRRHHGQRDFRPLPKSGVGATVYCHGSASCTRTQHWKLHRAPSMAHQV